LNNFIFGLRPVIEFLDEGKIPEKVFVQKGLTGATFQQLFKIIREKEIPFQMVPAEKLNNITKSNHQGIIAQIAEIEYQKIDHLLPGIYEKGETPLLVILDKITDIRNLGAIARSAEVAGAQAIIIGEKSSAPVNADAIKTSAGALTRIPVCKEKDLMETIAFLKESGIRVMACTEKSEKSIYSAALDGPIAIIMGSEEKGISKSNLMMATEKISIPQKGKIGSLNVSVATGIVLFEIIRQREFISTNKAS
jgi:23S rRNA (guanosine2251-2'-O)-methyltransferase